MKADRVLGHEVRVFDDGGKSIDRYTVVIDSDFVYGMSENNGPSGFDQYAGQLDDLRFLRSIYPSGDAKEGFKPISFKRLPETVQEMIRERISSEENSAEE